MVMRRLLCLSLLLAAGAASAAAVDPALFSDLRWRHIGPFRGGRVLAVAGVPGEPEHFYFGAVNGGVWETRDAGRTWQPIFDDQPIGSIGALALAPSNPRRIYVGSGEADMRSNIAQGNGIYRSDDGGQTWARRGLADSQQIGRILVHPQDPDLVYVAALGHPYGANPERGVMRSKDGGQSWQRVLFEDADTGAIDLAFKPDDPRVVYAALWQTRRPPWNVYPPSSGPGSGLFKSTDAGDTWTRISGNGLPAQHGRIGLAAARTRPDRLYAMVDAEQGGVYRSDDAGAHWQRLNHDERLWGRGWYFGGIAVDPRDADLVYVLNVSLWRSQDGGHTFTLTKGAPGGDDYHEIWIDAQNPDRQILGVDQGAVVTQNGGATWSSWFNQATAQMYRVVTDNRFPYWVYGAQQDSGAAGVPSRTGSIDGINLTNFREVTAGGENGSIAPDPRDPQVIYGGSVDRLDLRTLQTQAVDPAFAHPGAHRDVWTMPLVFSRRDPRLLYFADERLYRTADGGRHWDVISPDLTREDPGTPANLDAPTLALNLQRGPRRGVIYAISPSRTVAGEIWVGTDDGLVWRTRDEGGHWTNVTPAGVGAWSKIAALEVSPHAPESAYAAVDRHRLDDFAPHIYRTHDGGRSWQEIVTGIPGGEAVNVVRADPLRAGLLYAGTERSVHVSFDDGDHWQSLKANLPVTSVRDLEVHGDDLVIATHGRGFWILDDVAPLRQAAAVAVPGRPLLYRPSVAVRARGGLWLGTPMPHDEPRAANPPAGAYLDYVLARQPREPVVLEVRDAQGLLARRYSSAEAPPDYNPATTRVAPEWFAQPARLRTSPGMHRFVWPLRYAAPPALADGNAYADGVWAPPGSYTVTLTVDGERLTQPLTLAPDPRVTLAPEGYAAQFALARQIEAQREVVARAAAQARELTKALAARRGAASGGLAGALAALEAAAHDLAGSQPIPNGTAALWRPTRHDRNWQFLAQVLEKLDAAVQGADAAPSPDARAGLARYEPIVAAVLQDWQRLLESDLAALDRQLAAAGQAPVLP